MKMTAVCVVLAQYICGTRYHGPRFTKDAMHKHFPNAGDVSKPLTFACTSFDVCVYLLLYMLFCFIAVYRNW